MNPYQPPQSGSIKPKPSRSFVSIALGVIFIGFGALLLLSSLRNIFVGMDLWGSGSYAVGYIGGSLLMTAISAYLIFRGFKKLKPR